MVAAIGRGEVFAKGCDFGARLDLVPKPTSTGDRTILGKISKRGNCSLRVLFVRAARVVMIKPKSWERHALKPWIEAAKKQRHRNVLAVGLAPLAGGGEACAEGALSDSPGREIASAEGAGQARAGAQQSRRILRCNGIGPKGNSGSLCRVANVRVALAYTLCPPTSPMRLSSLYLGQKPPSAQVAWGFCFSNCWATIRPGHAPLSGGLPTCRHSWP
jgi:hypothetical protein